jgi:hypothetical protein
MSDRTRLDRFEGARAREPVTHVIVNRGHNVHVDETPLCYPCVASLRHKIYTLTWR